MAETAVWSLHDSPIFWTDPVGASIGNQPRSGIGGHTTLNVLLMLLCEELMKMPQAAQYGNPGDRRKMLYNSLSAQSMKPELNNLPPNYLNMAMSRGTV